MKIGKTNYPSLVNSFNECFIESRSGFVLHGFVPVSPGGYDFSFCIGEQCICPVYGSRHYIEQMWSLGDDEQLEQQQIADGKTAVLFFKGNDNTSYTRRMTPEEYDIYVLTEFKLEENDMHYNS